MRDSRNTKQPKARNGGYADRVPRYPAAALLAGWPGRRGAVWQRSAPYLDGPASSATERCLGGRRIVRRATRSGKHGPHFVPGRGPTARSVIYLFTFSETVSLDRAARQPP